MEQKDDETRKGGILKQVVSQISLFIEAFIHQGRIAGHQQWGEGSNETTARVVTYGGRATDVGCPVLLGFSFLFSLLCCAVRLGYVYCRDEDVEADRNAVAVSRWKDRRGKI